jgi:hypothetical protein
MSRFSTELRLKTEAEDKESGQGIDPYIERKETGPSQRPSQMAVTEVEAIMHRTRGQKRASASRRSPMQFDQDCQRLRELNTERKARRRAPLPDEQRQRFREKMLDDIPKEELICHNK